MRFMQKQGNWLTIMMLLGMVGSMMIQSAFAQPSVTKRSGPAGLSSHHDEPVQNAFAKPVVDSIQFTGNQEIPAKLLTEDIPLKAGHEMDENLLMQSMVKIAECYKTHQMKITITPIIGKTLNGHTQIQFKIHEMKKNS